ncbi:MAG: YifB family Mg chelatase-like AAA ATPase [Deltaproteobacteria bacterium]|nr:YifB family Mg chelatase-like AAA ATPase [Deltaproteobacteria bacterium]
MAVKVVSGALEGVDAIPIEVEVDLLRRLPAVSVVGLAHGAVKEAAERVRSAIQSADLTFPRKRVVVNLAPADVRKDGTAFDLPVAIGILAADGAVPVGRLNELLVVGELSLGGGLRPVRGALALALLARALDKTLVLPTEAARAAALVPGVRVLGAGSLAEVVAWMRGELELLAPAPQEALPRPATVDLSEVRGQGLARRALEIAAAGAHHLHMTGRPGCGKSMLAHRLPTILPSLTPEEALDVTRIHSVARLLPPGAPLVRTRPFRAPHHTVTGAGMVGDLSLRPGELSLAHQGVLFLDEATEFSRVVLEQLRTPLEEGVVRLRRARGAVTYPAAFTLVMASNPCPCGNRGSDLPCQCTDGEVARYRRRLSGPILDRVDLHVELRAVAPDELLSAVEGESSEQVRQRVTEARSRQLARGQKVPNGRLSAAEVELHVQLVPEARVLLVQAGEQYGLSGRALTRVMKVGRTIADLAGTPVVERPHIAEALAFRPLEEV